MQMLQIEKDSREHARPSENESIVEVRLLLEAQLLTSLETVATREGQSPALLIRRLIRDFLQDSGSALSTL
jgi:hypothetical protein